MIHHYGIPNGYGFTLLHSQDVKFQQKWESGLSANFVYICESFSFSYFCNKFFLKHCQKYNFVSKFELNH